MNAKTAFVTGASTGIGRSTAVRLAGAGWRVIGSVRGPEAAAELAARGVDAIELDVTRAADLAALPERLATKLGDAGAGDHTDYGLDALVNNAGVVAPGPLEFLRLETLRDQLEVNLVGLLGVTQAVLPALRRRRGRIVQISSISGRVAFPFEGAYNASKFALEGLSDTLRLELAEWGIHVVAIEPGSVRTPIWKRMLERWNAEKGALSPRARELYGARLERWEREVEVCATQGLEPDEVARVVQRALTVRRPRAHYTVGSTARRFDLARRVLPASWLDRRILR